MALTGKLPAWEDRFREIDAQSRDCYTSMESLGSHIRSLTEKIKSREPGTPIRTPIEKDDSVVVKVKNLSRAVTSNMPVILYVDDDKDNRMAFGFTFEDQFQLHLADGAEEALQILTREHIDILVTDQCMPGTTGLELCLKVKVAYPTVRRFIVSAYADFKVAIAAVNDARVDRFISKPWERQSLVEAFLESP